MCSEAYTYSAFPWGSECACEVSMRYWACPLAICACSVHLGADWHLGNEGFWESLTLKSSRWAGSSEGANMVSCGPEVIHCEFRQRGSRCPLPIFSFSCFLFAFINHFLFIFSFLSLSLLYCLFRIFYGLIHSHLSLFLFLLWFLFFSGAGPSVLE